MYPELESTTCDACKAVAVRWNPYNHGLECHACGKSFWRRTEDGSISLVVATGRVVVSAVFADGEMYRLAVLGALVDKYSREGNNLGDAFADSARGLLALEREPSHARRLLELIGGENAAHLEALRRHELEPLHLACCRLIEATLPIGWRYHVVIEAPDGATGSGGNIPEIHGEEVST